MADDDALPAAFATDGAPVDVEYNALGFDLVVRKAEEKLRQMHLNMTAYVRDLAGSWRGRQAVDELEKATLEFSECESESEDDDRPRKRRRQSPSSSSRKRRRRRAEDDDDEEDLSDSDDEDEVPRGITELFDTRRRKWPGVRDLDVPASVRTDAWCLLCDTSPQHVKLDDGTSVHEAIHNTVTRGMAAHEPLEEIIVSVYIIWNVYVRPLVKTVRSTLHANQEVLCPHWSVRSIVRHWRESSSDTAARIQQRVMRQDVYHMWEALAGQTVPQRRSDPVNRENARVAFQFARLWREMKGGGGKV
jgi:hypothetical protein